jgi:hypothetical protein
MVLLAEMLGFVVFDRKRTDERMSCGVREFELLFFEGGWADARTMASDDE